MLENIWMIYPDESSTALHLNIGVPTHQFHVSIISQFPGLKGVNMNGEEFITGVLTFMREQLVISFDGDTMKLQSLDAQFGGHDGTLRFLLPDIPPDPSQMDISLKGFHDKHVDHRFMVYNHGRTISRKAGHDETELHFDISVDHREASAIPGSLLIGVILLFFLLAAALFRRQSRE